MSLIFWVRGAQVAKICVYNGRTTDFLFSLPIIPMLFRTKGYRATPINYARLGLNYTMSILGVILLFTL